MSTNPQGRSFPPFDERLVEPESGREVIRGEVIEVSPAKYRHWRPHSRLAALLEAYVVDSHVVGVDALGRYAHDSDFATDVCVRPGCEEPDDFDKVPDELSFEILSTQSLGRLTIKAEDLADRGVRRIFAIDVPRQQLWEWDHATRCFVRFEAEAIEDPLFKLDLPVAEVLSSGSTNEAVQQALLTEPTPVLEAALSDARTEARSDVVRSVIGAALDRLRVRGLPVAADTEASVRGVVDPATAIRVLEAAQTCEQAADLLHLLGPR